MASQISRIKIISTFIDEDFTDLDSCAKQVHTCEGTACHLYGNGCRGDVTSASRELTSTEYEIQEALNRTHML